MLIEIYIYIIDIYIYNRYIYIVGSKSWCVLFLMKKWWYSMVYLDPIMQNRRVMNNGILERTSMH